MSKKVYAFSGLGADYRAFQNLDFAGMELVHMDWIPARTYEYLESYVLRLAQHHQIPKQGATVIGISFGGICIAELAKFYDFEKIVLLSAAKTKYELPNSLAVKGLYGLQKLIPKSQLIKPSFMLNWLFGVSNPVDKALLAAILADTDPKFLKWAIQQIVDWDNTSVPPNCLHIHGDQDRIIPIGNVDYSIKIKGAGHLMALSKGKEISFHIRNFLL